MTIARAWCRIDLAGGTLDIWPLGLLHTHARTINVAVDLAVTVEIESAGTTFRVQQGASVAETSSLDALQQIPEAALPALIAAELGLPPFAARIESASPQGAGLGASSAMAVAFIAAAEAHFGLPLSSTSQRAWLARDLEARLMQLPTGIQDHYPAQLGGALEIALSAGGERVRAVDTNLQALGDSLLVMYSGQSHLSARQNWSVVRRRLDAEPQVISLLAAIAEVAAELRSALVAGDLPRVGELMGQEWSHRRQLAPHVSTPMLESLLGAAQDAGAWGGKACGAGGGGCVAVLCPVERRESIRAALERKGGMSLAARPVATPMEVSQRLLP